MSNVSAVVLMEQEVSWQDGRLQYELVSGAGPRNGWVTVNVKGKDLLVQMPAVQKDGNRNRSESLGSQGFQEVRYLFNVSYYLGIPEPFPA